MGGGTTGPLLSHPPPTAALIAHTGQEAMGVQLGLALPFLAKGSGVPCDMGSRGPGRRSHLPRHECQMLLHSLLTREGRG